MKRFLTLALAEASVGFIAAGAASALDTYNDGDAANGIGNSRHNLGSFDLHVMTTGTTEICVFCHTPHHTNTSNSPPWNRGTSTASYTAYGSTIANTSVASGDLGPTTLACLSCHDGVTTLDNIVNKPGKGGLQGGSAGWAIYEDAVQVSNTITSSRLVIGTDLSNDHPVSVTYYGEDSPTPRASLRDTSTQLSMIDLTADLASSASTYDNGNLTQNLWAVKGYISSAATIGDLLRNGKVECSSCHDPHFSNKSFNEVDATYDSGETDSNGLFLRRVGGNTGSGVCRTCHNK